MAEAVAQLQKGLDMLATLPDGPWHRQRELDLLITLRPAAATIKGWSATEVGEIITRALSLAEQIDRAEYLVPLIMAQWVFHLLRAEHKPAIAFAEQMERIGETRNDAAVQLQGRHAKGGVLFHLGELVAARVLQEQCQNLGDAAHRSAGGVRSTDPYATMMGQLALTLVYLGYIDQGRSKLNEAMSKARQLKQAPTLAEVLLCANWIEVVTRSPGRQRCAEELLTLSTEHGFPYYSGWATAFSGWSLAALGQAQQGLRLLSQGLMAVRATANITSTPGLFMGLAEVYAMLGQPSEGLKCVTEAAQLIETTEQRIDEAELHRLRGDLLNATGDRFAAEHSYHQALAVAQRQSAKLFELRATTSLARLWRDQDKRTEARDLLAPIHDWFTEGFDTPVLKEAKALLDELT